MRERKTTVATLTTMSVSYDKNYETAVSEASTRVLKAALMKETRKNAQAIVKRELRKRGKL